MKTIKSSAIKVDTLRHIKDHGMSVQFSCPKLQRVLAQLVPDGEYSLEAGQSHLTIQRLGHVTAVRAFFSVGSYEYRSIHYCDSGAGLKLAVHAGYGHTAPEDNAHDTLVAIVFGGTLPRIWSPSSGEGQDVLRTWLRTYAWTLTGEAGMRGQAIKLHAEQLRAAVRSEENGLAYQQRELSRLGENSFERQHTHLRERTQQQLATCERRHDVIESHLATLADPTLSQSALGEIAEQNGCRTRWDYSRNRHVNGFPAAPASFSTPVVRCNYTATINGDSLVLSSGIVCEASVSAIAAWLSGNGPQPRTRYGLVNRIDGCDAEGKPVSVLQCGCHYVSFEGVSPIGELLVPAHTVTVTPALPACPVESPEFPARLRDRIVQRQTENAQMRATHLRNYLESKTELEQEAASLPDRIAAQQERVASATASLDAAKTRYSALVLPLGSTDAQGQICAALLSQWTKGSLT